MQKILSILFISILSVSLTLGQDYQNIRQEVLKDSNSDLLKHGEWGVYAHYVDSGKEIIDYNSEKSMAPASGLKVFTTSTALNLLGEDYTFKTKLYYDGYITDDGVLVGDIYIVGGGDPTLGSDLVKGSLPLDSLVYTWGIAVKKLGIKRIAGSVMGDASLFDGKRVPDYWNWMDIGNYYGAGTSALTIHDNLYYLYFHPSPVVGDKAELLSMDPEIPGMNFINHMKTGAKGSGDNGYIYGGPGQFNATLRGTVPTGVSAFSIKGSIPDPALFAAQYLEKYLKAIRISVSLSAGTVTKPVKYDPSKLITETVSPPLKDIVYITNKKSDNLYTEQLLKTLGLKEKGEGSTEAGITVIENYLKANGVSTEGLKLYDGCGLSRTDMITPKIMVQVLTMMTKKKAFNSFYNSLAVAGKADDPGYFTKFGVNSPLENNARIKSGLITGVRSESGYVRDKAGRLITFSFIANNYTGTSRQVDRLHEKLLIMLAKLN